MHLVAILSAIKHNQLLKKHHTLTYIRFGATLLDLVFSHLMKTKLFKRVKVFDSIISAWINTQFRIFQRPLE